MKRFFAIVISIAMLAIVGYGIAYMVIPKRSVALEEYTHELSISCDDAYIVRDETVYYSTTTGTVYNTAQEGERVGKNESVSSIFPGNIDEAYIKQLRTIDAKINRLNAENSGSGLYTTDAASIENEVSQRMNDVFALAEADDVAKIHENREDINGYRLDAPVSSADKLAALESEREAVEAALNGAKAETISDREGIFSSYVDGLEAVLAPDRVKEYSTSYIRSLEPQELSKLNGAVANVGDKICKVMNNHEWYVLGIVGAKKHSPVKEGQTVMVRFSEISQTASKGTVTFVSVPDENGESIFLVRVPTYVEAAFSYRKLKADIIIEEYSGYKVPIDALHPSEDINKYYVNAMRGSDTYKCDCEVLYTDTDNGFSIIRSTEDAANKLSAMERLVMEER